MYYYFMLEYNDSYAFKEYPTLTKNQLLHQSIVTDMSGRDRSSVRRCEACKGLLDKWHIPLLGLRIRQRKRDLSMTYDGVIVASTAFVNVCEMAGMEGIRFHRLPDDPDFFRVDTCRSVLFDAERRATRFLGHCGICGQYDEIIGANPVLLREGEQIADAEVVRTDLEFGSDDGKAPLLICSDVAKRSLASHTLKGVRLFELDK